MDRSVPIPPTAPVTPDRSGPTTASSATASNSATASIGRVGRPTRTSTSNRTSTSAADAFHSSADGPPAVEVLGLAVGRHTRVEARARIAALASRPDHHVVAFVNAHALNLASRDAVYRNALARADLVLNDGLGLALAARLAGSNFPDNLNGTDLMPEVLTDLAAHRRRVFFYGAAPGVAAATARHWGERIPGLTVSGTLDGFSVSGAAAAELIRSARTDVVLVALGNPRQELWAQQFGPRTGARLTIGVGAFFDFSVGVVRRAPGPFRRAHLEWAFRFAQEPRRLAGRYLVGIPAFLARVGWAHLRGAAASVAPPSFSDPGVVVPGPWPTVDLHVDRTGGDGTWQVG